MSQAEFDAAAKWIQELPKDGPVQATQDEKLKAYGLFKQVNVGDAQDKDKPGMMANMGEAGYKYAAWSENKGKSTDQAMKEYVAHIDSLKKKYNA